MLVKIQTNEQGEQLVSARALHEKLEVKTRFDTWIKRKIEKYGFVENIDFTTVDQKRATAQGNKTELKDYILKLDMAKEISMIENNDKGREIRQYFIEAEKKLMVALENQVKQLEKATKKPKKDKRLEFLLGNVDSISFLSEEVHRNISKIDKILDEIYDQKKHLARYALQIRRFGEDVYKGEKKTIELVPEGYKRGRRKKK